jgi:hypothetical protein
VDRDLVVVDVGGCDVVVVVGLRLARMERDLVERDQLERHQLERHVVGSHVVGSHVVEREPVELR